MNKECDFCDIRFDFKKSDLKERVFAKVGDTFEAIEQESKISTFGSKKIFHTITWALNKDIKFKGVECECCGKVNWVTDLIPVISDIESNGWYLKEYRDIKCHEVSRKTKSYKCTKEEAKEVLLNNIASDVLSEKAE
jgi:hypothetical protein